VLRWAIVAASENDNDDDDDEPDEFAEQIAELVSQRLRTHIERPGGARLRRR
jgi:hypothetical protein